MDRLLQALLIVAVGVGNLIAWQKGWVPPAVPASLGTVTVVGQPVLAYAATAAVLALPALLLPGRDRGGSYVLAAVAGTLITFILGLLFWAAGDLAHVVL